MLGSFLIQDIDYKTKRPYGLIPNCKVLQSSHKHLRSKGTSSVLVPKVKGHATPEAECFLWSWKAFEWSPIASQAQKPKTKKSFPGCADAYSTCTIKYYKFSILESYREATPELCARGGNYCARMRGRQISTSTSLESWDEGACDC